MNKVFLIDGASGTGKSDLIGFVKENLSNYDINIVKKNTTRPRRSKEEAPEIDEELDFFTADEFQQKGLDNKNKYYVYKYGGHQYSFNKEALKESASKHEFSFVIVRNKKLIDVIKKELENTALTFYLYLYTDEELVRARLQNDGFGESDITRRIERNKEAWNDYITTPDDEVIVIVNSSNRDEFHRKIRLLVEKYSDRFEDRKVLHLAPNIKILLPKALVGYKDQMVRALSRSPFEKNIFLMMKFRKNNMKYYDAIKLCLERYGYNCIRADLPEWDITRETHNYIAVAMCCKYGIALFDEPEVFTKGDIAYRIDYSPNVAYELGLMQAYDKNCLVLKHSSLSDAPFDLVKDLLVTYDDLDMIPKIEKWVKKISDND